MLKNVLKQSFASVRLFIFPQCLSRKEADVEHYRAY